MLRDNDIILDVEEREAEIWRKANIAAAEVAGKIPEHTWGDLLAEVAMLVECPTVLRGGYSKEFLHLPK